MAVAQTSKMSKKSSTGHPLERSLKYVASSFDQFEVEVFRYLMRRGYPGYNIPKRKTVRRHLTSGAEKAREEIKSRFENHDGHISLALDCWTSSNRWEFMGTTPPQCRMISVLKSTN